MGVLPLTSGRVGVCRLVSPVGHGTPTQVTGAVQMVDNEYIQ